MRTMFNYLFYIIFCLIAGIVIGSILYDNGINFEDEVPNQVVTTVNPADILTRNSASDNTSNAKIHCDINRSFIDNSVSSIDCK
jgi:hypothetical protein